MLLYCVYNRRAVKGEYLAKPWREYCQLLAPILRTCDAKQEERFERHWDNGGKRWAVEAARATLVIALVYSISMEEENEI